MLPLSQFNTIYFMYLKGLMWHDLSGIQVHHDRISARFLLYPISQFVCVMCAYKCTYVFMYSCIMYVCIHVCMCVCVCTCACM